MYFIIEPTDGQHIKCKDSLLRARRVLITHVHLQRVTVMPFWLSTVGMLDAQTAAQSSLVPR